MTILRARQCAQILRLRKCNTKQKQRYEIFQFRISSESGRKTLHHIYLNV